MKIAGFPLRTSTFSLFSLLIGSALIFAIPGSNAAEIPINNYLTCTSPTEMNCIVSLQAEFADGHIVEATPTGKVNTWDSRDFEQNIRTYSATEWEVSGLKNSSGTNTVVTQIWMQKPITVGTTKDYGALDITIFASLFDSPQDLLDEQLCKKMKVVSECKIPPQFTENIRFKMVLNTNSLEPGMTSGSVENVSYIQKKFLDGLQLTISGNAMEIPINLPVEGGTGPGEFKQSLANRLYWHMYTVDQRNTYFNWTKGKNCSSDNPVISSNAALAGFPEFDKSTQEIKLKVASPHTKFDGKTLEVGQFRANISLSGISCLWGIDSESLSPQASVGISYEDGSSTVAVLTSTVRDQNFTIQATGYHYSSPTIKLKLSSPPAAVVKKKTSIICTKGKTVKKITSQNPSCPKGYKKK